MVSLFFSTCLDLLPPEGAGAGAGVGIKAALLPREVLQTMISERKGMGSWRGCWGSAPPRAPHSAKEIASVSLVREDEQEAMGDGSSQDSQGQVGRALFMLLFLFFALSPSDATCAGSAQMAVSA